MTATADSSSKFVSNSFQVPNAIVDDLLCRMPPTAIKCYLLIVRKTLGWHKMYDSISLSQFEQFTGSKKSAVHNAVKWLEKMDLISREFREGKTTTYFINPTPTLPDGWEGDPATDVDEGCHSDGQGVPSTRTGGATEVELQKTPLQNPLKQNPIEQKKEQPFNNQPNDNNKKPNPRLLPNNIKECDGNCEYEFNRTLCETCKENKKLAKEFAGKIVKNMVRVKTWSKYFDVPKRSTIAKRWFEFEGTKFSSAEISKQLDRMIEDGRFSESKLTAFTTAIEHAAAVLELEER